MDAENLAEYMVRNGSRTNHYPKAFKHHMDRLYTMVVAHLVGAFERFLKETAATCVEFLCDFGLDGRLDEFSVKGSAAAAHFAAGTIGDALCEADTWLECRRVNDRFRKLLADPFDSGRFWAFPGRGQQPTAEQFRRPIMASVFQLRHTIVHNLGVVTKSDATKLRQLLNETIVSDKVLAPRKDDIRYLKRFLDETASSLNKRVADRLASLLTTLHQDGYLAFDPGPKADGLADVFGVRVTVAGETRA